ncbi:MAG: methyltransferase domain-containing protein [Acidimicrobiia bacterium]|nr:methyltransferase domain-containing protein [Acidimicrobiia bacterium]
MSWDPAQYRRYEGHRLRPAIELLQRVVIDDPTRVVDLGCGTGNSTALLADRWPTARVVGVDNSTSMLDAARADRPDLHWIHHDIATWAPDEAAEVIYSNAALHWVDDHDELLPRLVTQLGPDGILAFQVPDNFREPTHTLVGETALEGPWADVLGPLLRSWSVRQPEEYTRLLGPHVDSVDAWRTTYVQRLHGNNPVAQWTKGSVLRPLLGALTSADADAFFAAYARRIARAYPAEDDGTTLLPFSRVFVVARR